MNESEDSRNDFSSRKRAFERQRRAQEAVNEAREAKAEAEAYFTMTRSSVGSSSAGKSRVSLAFKIILSEPVPGCKRAEPEPATMRSSPAPANMPLTSEGPPYSASSPESPSIRTAPLPATRRSSPSWPRRTERPEGAGGMFNPDPPTK